MIDSDAHGGPGRRPRPDPPGARPRLRAPRRLRRRRRGRLASREGAAAGRRSSSPTSWSPTSGSPTAPGSTWSAGCAAADDEVGHRRADHVRRRRAAVRRPRGRRLGVRGQGRPLRRRRRRRPARHRLPALVHGRRPGRRHAAPDVARPDRSCPPRETEVLRLLAEGLGVAAIARQLFVSESTAKTHISKIYEKLGAANRAQAIMNRHPRGPPVRRFAGLSRKSGKNGPLGPSTAHLGSSDWTDKPSVLPIQTEPGVPDPC